jgi:hypothetical protein
MRHFMYSLPNPSESERPFSPLEEPVLGALGRRGGRGSEQNGTDSYALRQGRHAIGRGGHRIQRPDIISSGQLALGWRVRWGGGMGTGSEREGSGVFFTADLC